MKFKISEIAQVVGGGTPSTKEEDNYANSGVAWITPKDLSGYTQKYIANGSRDISEKGLNSSSAKLMPKGTVLVSSRAPIGYVAIADGPLATNQGFKSLVPNKDVVTSEYLYYVMKQSKSALEQVATGTTFKEVSGSVMKNFEIDIPNLDEQERVVSILAPIDQKIELLQTINDNLLELGRSYYQNFVDTHDTEGQMVSTIAESVITGKTPSTKDESNYGDDVPFVTIPDMHSQIFTTKTTRSLSKKGADSQVKKYLPPFTLSVSSIGTPGLVTINPEESQTNQQINSVIAEKEKIWYLFLAFDSLKAHIENMGSGGSTILNLNKSNFEKIDIDWPIDKSALIEFNTVIEPIFMNILNNQREIDSLSMVRDTLLSELI